MENLDLIYSNANQTIFKENSSINSNTEFPYSDLYDDYDIEDFPQLCELTWGIEQYYLPFIIVFGLVGNLLALLVFTTSHLRIRSSSYYLAALSLADLGFLAVLLIVYCSVNGLVDVYHSYGWCQVFVYLSSVCSALSVWLTVTFTIERFIAVQYPLQRPHICTVSRARATVATLVTLSAVSHIYIYWTAGITEYEEGKRCKLIGDNYSLMRVMNTLDTFGTMVIPLILIVVFNTLIIKNICQFRRTMLLNHDIEMESSSRTSHVQQLGSQDSGPSTSTARRQAVNQHDPDTCVIQMNDARPVGRTNITRRNQQSVTKMLLIISTVFVILNLPSYICRFYVFIFNLVATTERPPTVLWCIQQLSMLLFYTNYCINFLLYSMCGASFRRCLLKLLQNTLRRIIKFLRCGH